MTCQYLTSKRERGTLHTLFEVKIGRNNGYTHLPEVKNWVILIMSKIHDIILIVQ